ncbi:D-glycero-beta-D-manno-heptose-7-phosphate kinase [Candidatus Woesearchaeota archaeon]|nr:D-glycero-beta-D-manno-heptose-7-phosphate kinase [Candidatus Woesearchaeota archaeon]
MKDIINKFKNQNILVIGDLILDKYIFGNVERISPEAPVPVIEVKKEMYVPGGAANAANNVSSLGGRAFLLGIVGEDTSKDILLEEARNKGISTEGIITDPRKPTIQKIRVVGQNQQLLRIDYEDKSYIDNEEKIIERIKNKEKIGAILISDYAKGTITKKLMKDVLGLAKKKNIILIIDPKPRHKSFYKSCYLITPNKKEAEEMTNMAIKTEEDLEKAGTKLMEELDCNVLITTGERGMSLFEKKNAPIHIPTLAKEVYDVSGAGDTVIATLSLALSSRASLKDAAVLANHAAGIKVGKLGTAPVSAEELKNSLDNNA